MSWIVAKLNIKGFRGVLDRAGDFELAEGRSPRSIAIYAPNATGKSSYADAVEYLFSKDGRLAHIGSDESALAHLLAQESQVSITLVNSVSGESIQVSRPVKTDQANKMPPGLVPVVRAAPAHRVLRQHNLRRFVAEISPGARYAELSRWFGLGRLEIILEHLGIASNELAGRDLDREIKERVQDIARHTRHAVTGHDEQAVLDWCAAEAERHLGKSLVIDSPTALKRVIRTLRRFQGRILLSSAAAESYQAKLALEQATGDLADQVEVCHTTLADAVAAQDRTTQALGAAKNSVFQEVWSAAQEVLETRTTDQCPVCFTPWGKGRVGTQRGALVILSRSLDELASLTTARGEQRKATRQLQAALRELGERLSRVSTGIGKLPPLGVETPTPELVTAVKQLSAADRFPSQMRDECEELLERCRQFAAGLEPALQSLQVVEIPVTAGQVEETIEHLQALWDTLTRLGELRREREEYQKIECDFDVVARAIQERAAVAVNEVVAALQDNAQSIYRMIHPTAVAPNLRIIPDTESRTLKMRIDLGGGAVAPAAYLSESQINTLGLALFISSVSLFNRQFPFLFLDDVVSTYDANHKARIVDLIAERLDGFQVFLTTHDRRFYSKLKLRLRDRGWLFARISGWDLERGPRW